MTCLVPHYSKQHAGAMAPSAFLSENRMNISSFTRTLSFLFTLCVLPVGGAFALTIPAAPQLSAKSYILMDASNGQVLVDNNADQQLPPASLTKLMTAYIATLQIGNGQIKESDLVPVSEKAWKTGGSKMFIKVGSQVSVSDLLHGIIIQSGNDASVALAEYIGATEDGFVEIMNKTAQKLGLTHTHFMNATGLPDPNHYSSAHDMAILAHAIIHDEPSHYAIYAQKEFLWNNIKQPNRNLLLWRDPTVDGLKTGHTEEAGYCMVASALRDGQRLIAVLFGMPSIQARAEETQKLLTYGFRFFESHNVFKGGAEIGSTPVWKGKTHVVKAGVKEDYTLTLAKGQADSLKTEIVFQPLLQAPIAKGQVIGKANVKDGDKVVGSADLVALEPVEQASFFARLWDSLRMFIFKLFN